MNAANVLPRRWMGLAIVFALVLVPDAVLGKGPEGKARKPTVDALRAAKMVEAIVNHNKPPRLVEWKGDFTEQAALFPEDYDWKEDARAGEAIGRLEEDQTEAVWEEMVKRVGDRRYSEIVTSVKTGDAYIRDVGTVCNRLASSRLIGVFWQHLPPHPNPAKDGQLLYLDVGIDDLPKWRKQRADKKLYELQIEVCAEAIKALAKVKDVPQAQKDRSRKKIEAQIVTLKKTRRLLPAHAPYSFMVSGVYNAKLAKRVREGVKSGKYGDLGIIK